MLRLWPPALIRPFAERLWQERMATAWTSASLISFGFISPSFFDYPGKAAQAPGVVMRDQNGRLVVHEVSGEQPEFLLELPA
jgi:hypothetical protein